MTECVHIGSFDEPIMVFGGPYGNLEATAALLAAAQRARIPPARMLCTGDLVAYCADPQATVDVIRGAGITVIMGNCDESLGQGAADCDCGFAKGSTCDILTVQWFAYASRVLDADAKVWMRTLPRQVALTLAGRRLVAVHGNANQINRFVFASTASTETLEACAHLDADGILGGHAGLPFTEITQDCLWHNAGVIGVPANDATPRVWYSILRRSTAASQSSTARWSMTIRLPQPRWWRADCHARTQRHSSPACGPQTTSCPTPSDTVAANHWLPTACFGRTPRESGQAHETGRAYCMAQHGRSRAPPWYAVAD